MKLALLIFGILATGIGALVFFALAVASSWAEDMAATHLNPESTTPSTDET